MAPPRTDSDPAPMPMGDHIDELRLRLIRCLLAVAAGMILAWVFREPVQAVLRRPHVLATQAVGLDARLRFETYPGAIVPQLKACLAASLIVTAPYLLWNVWAFVAPGLHHRERRWVARLLMPSLGLFALGVLFGYFVFLPISLQFLLRMAPGGTEPMIFMGPYYGLLLVLTVMLGLAFQTPLVVVALVRTGVFGVDEILSYRKAAILGAFILAAFLTPPDPFTQVLMAVPLVVLLDVGILIAAPSRAAWGNLLRFAAVVVAVAVVCVGAYRYWPVGRMTTAGRAVVSVLRGRDVQAPAEGQARIDFGRGGGAVRAAPGTRLRVEAARSVRLVAGALLVEAAGAPIEVRTGPARVTSQDGLVEITMSPDGAVTVNVARGAATVQAAGRTDVLRAGRTETYRAGGRPWDAGRMQDRWVVPE